MGLLKGKVKVGAFGNNITAKLHLDDWVQQLIYFFGIYEFEKAETKAWVTLAEKSNFIFDIGANIGYYSLLAAECNQACTIHAFEPAPVTYKRLQENVQLNNFQSIQLHNLGVSDKRGFLPLYLANDDNSGMTSLSQPISFSGTIVEVEVIVFDEFIQKSNVKGVDLVKIDVEGNEFNVLAGMKHSIANYRPVIFIELLQEHLLRFNSSTKEVFSFFETLNYKCLEFERNGTIIHSQLPRDIGLALFVPAEKESEISRQFS